MRISCSDDSPAIGARVGRGGNERARAVPLLTTRYPVRFQKDIDLKEVPSPWRLARMRDRLRRRSRLAVAASIRKWSSVGRRIGAARLDARWLREIEASLAPGVIAAACFFRAYANAEHGPV